MLVVYGVCLVVGGVLIAASIIMGGHDADADADAGGALDHEVAHDVGHAAGAHAPGDAGHASPAAGDVLHAWTLFLNLRFWTFFLCFFGLTGVILSLPRLLDSAAAILVVSLASGVLCGFGAAYAIAKLRVKEVGRLPGATDFEGTTAKALLPFAPGGRGTVRATLRGESVDLMAVNEDQQAIERGDEVLIVSYREGLATVTRVSLSAGGAA